MLKKDLGLLILLIVVSGIVAFLNPRFISPINLSNTANLVGLFGLISVGQGFGSAMAGPIACLCLLGHGLVGSRRH